ncbi:hypothetical protein BJ742DRAFT_508293 [Cladochytrium replicatum]|nr:hypothetical protein BJ742DRAFT_508293 [Cladochytrium replicatum]
MEAEGNRIGSGGSKPPSRRGSARASRDLFSAGSRRSSARASREYIGGGDQPGATLIATNPNSTIDLPVIPTSTPASARRRRSVIVLEDSHIPGRSARRIKSVGVLGEDGEEGEGSPWQLSEVDESFSRSGDFSMSRSEVNIKNLGHVSRSSAPSSSRKRTSNHARTQSGRISGLIKPSRGLSFGSFSNSKVGLDGRQYSEAPSVGTYDPYPLAWPNRDARRGTTSTRKDRWAQSPERFAQTQKNTANIGPGTYDQLKTQVSDVSSTAFHSGVPRFPETHQCTATFVGPGYYKPMESKPSNRGTSFPWIQAVHVRLGRIVQPCSRQTVIDPRFLVASLETEDVPPPFAEAVQRKLRPTSRMDTSTSQRPHLTPMNPYSLCFLVEPKDSV